MFEHMTRSQSLLAAATGSTLCIGLAVAVGVVPRPGAPSHVFDPSAANRSTVTAAASSPLHPAASPIGSVPTPPAGAPAVVSTPTAAAQRGSAPQAVGPHGAAHHSTPVSSPAVAQGLATANAAAVAPVAGGPAAGVSSQVARRTPSSAEVQQAIAGLAPYVHSPFTPSGGQVAQLGDEVCSAFDQGQPAAQVKATILQEVSQLPLTTISPGAADYVVRTAVTLYCPGHAAQVG